MQQASPEQQRQYEELAARALMFLYDKRVAMPLMEVIRDSDEPQEGLGIAASMIFSRLDAAAQAKGQQIPDDMRLAVAAEVLGNLGEIATEAGVHDFMGNQKDMEGAWFVSLDRYRAMQESAGGLDPAQARQDAEVLRAANESGELEAMLEGVSPQASRGLMPGG